MWLRGVRLLDLTPPLRRPGPRGSHPSTDEYPVVDLHIRGGHVAEISPASTWNGTWVLPGLWARHVQKSARALTYHRLDPTAPATPADPPAVVQTAAAPGAPPLPAATQG